MRTCSELDVLAAKGCDLAIPEARLNGDEQQCPRSWRFEGIARTRWHCKAQAGSLIATYWKKAWIAANLLFRVRVQLPRSSSRCWRNCPRKGTSKSSMSSLDGDRPRRLQPNWRSSRKASR
jgi:hypothetical protein